MADVVVTCPKWFWAEWIAEGDPAGEPWSGTEWGFYLGGRKPQIGPDERVYVVAHGKLRGYAPLVRIHDEPPGKGWASATFRWALIRAGGAVAVTIEEPIRGFQGWRYRVWNREDEVPFPDWRRP